MPTQVQFRRGNTTATSTFTGANGEISIDTDKKALIIHDGVTAGGYPVLTADNSALTGNTTAVNISITGKFFAGNTTANLTANSTLLNISDATSVANLSPSSLVIGSAVVNSTVLTIATGNFSTGANVGANVNLTTSTIQVGNSSVNTQVNSSSITTTTLTGTSINIATGSFIANSTAVVIAEPLTANGTTGTSGQVLASNGTTGAPYWADNEATTPATYVQNTDSRTLSGNLVISGTSFTPSSNTVLLGNSTQRWVVLANTGDFTGTVTGTVANMSTSVNSALLTVGTSFIANTLGAFHTGAVNAASVTTSGFVANTTAIVPTSNNILLGNSTGRFVLSANSGNFSGDVTVSGNLTITGTTTYINTTTLNVGDNIVTLNADVESGDTPTQNAGLEVNRGSGANVSFIWNETDDAWNQGNTSITGYANVSVSVNSALITVGTNFIANTTGAFHTGTVNAASFTVGSNFIANSSLVTIGGAALEYATLTTEDTSQVAFDTFATASFRSAKYLVQMTSGSAYHMIELSVIHDGTTVYLSQYGEVKSGASLGTFDASITSGTLSMLITPANSVTVVKSIAKLIAV